MTRCPHFLRRQRLGSQGDTGRWDPGGLPTSPSVLADPVAPIRVVGGGPRWEGKQPRVTGVVGREVASRSTHRTGAWGWRPSRTPRCTASQLAWCSAAPESGRGAGGEAATQGRRQRVRRREKETKRARLRGTERDRGGDRGRCGGEQGGMGGEEPLGRDAGSTPRP